MRWAVTAAFYCALDCMQAHLIGRGITPRSHGQRDNALANPRNGIPVDVYDAYKGLRQRSEAARYYLQRFPPERVRTEVLDRRLARITAFVGL
jgi:hypothetical protein